MNRILLITLAFVMTFASMSEAKISRLEISPSVLINLAEGHSGATMGGAISTDLFFKSSFALRTTIGFTKSRYFPSELDYADANYSFWLSLAPYGELNFGNRLKPYLAVLGTFTTGNSVNFQRAPVGMERAPVTRLQTNYNQNHAFYSLGFTVGSKLRLHNTLHIFGEVSHYFYTSITDSKVFFGSDNLLFDREFDFEHNPTYLSLGLTYGFDITK